MLVTRRLAKSSILRDPFHLDSRLVVCAYRATRAGNASRPDQRADDRFDPQRTGANLTETTLTTANVDSGHFGRLRTYPVDGAVLAQPLYVRNVTISGAPRNVLFVATMNDKVYAFDTTARRLRRCGWRTSPIHPRSRRSDHRHHSPASMSWATSASRARRSSIRPAGTLPGRADEGERHLCAASPRAVDCDRPGARGKPSEDRGVGPGTAPDSTTSASGRIITFDAKMQSQRAGLALVNGVVLIAWAGHEDLPPYHGWIMAYDAMSLARVGIMSVCARRVRRRVWQGGRAPTIDASGFAYFATGDGAWDGTRNFGDSLLKLRRSQPASLSSTTSRLATRRISTRTTTT